MKLFSFTSSTGPSFGAVVDRDTGIELGGVPGLPQSLDELVAEGAQGLQAVRTYLDAQPTGTRRLDLEGLRYLPPLAPRKNVFCVGRNYRDHIIEGNLARGRDPLDFPKAVEFFTKPPTALIGHRGGIPRHAGVTQLLDYEVELGVVIGKRGMSIARADALAHVFGFTIVNDVTARDLQVRHGQWFKGKALDGSCPIGPWIVTRDEIPDPSKLDVELWVNDELRQRDNTGSMIFDVAAIIEELSQGLTLEPGDVIATGTPKGVGFALNPPRGLQVGDRVSARIGGLGELVNDIVAG